MFTKVIGRKRGVGSLLLSLISCPCYSIITCNSAFTPFSRGSMVSSSSLRSSDTLVVEIEAGFPGVSVVDVGKELAVGTYSSSFVITRLAQCFFLIFSSHYSGTRFRNIRGCALTMASCSGVGGNSCRSLAKRCSAYRQSSILS